MIILDNSKCTIYDSQISETEKVHLQKSQTIERIGRELCYNCSIIFWRMLEWTKICHRTRSNDDGTGMDTQLSDCSLKFLSIFDELIVQGIGFDSSFQIWIFFDSIFYGDTWSRRYEFGKLIHLSKGDTECTTDIFDRCTSGKSTKCTYLTDLIVSVFLSDIFDDSSSSFIGEIDIDIWHRYSCRIEKSFKEELISEGVDIGNPRQIGDDGTSCGSSTRSDWYIVFSCPSDEVSDDDEISIKSHQMDDCELVFETIKYFFIFVRESTIDAFFFHTSPLLWKF